MNSPAWVTDDPKPKPVDFGSSTNSGTRMNDEYIPKPKTSAARFVVQTARIRIIRMSTSAARLRVSTQTHATASTAATANRPSTRAEVQPHDSPSLTGRSSATSQPARSAAPVQSSRPGERTGDSGTKSCVPTVAAMTAIRGSQKSQWYDRCSTIGPARTIPRPPPIPRIAEIIAIPCGTRSAGNSSRMIANESGKIAPPAPWITRATISTQIELARPAKAVPTVSTNSIKTSTRFLPNMSPSRPAIGVITDALIRYALRIHAAPAVVVFRSCWIVSSAGATIDCISAYAIAPSARSAKVTL